MRCLRVLSSDHQNFLFSDANGSCILEGNLHDSIKQCPFICFRILFLDRTNRIKAVVTTQDLNAVSIHSAGRCTAPNVVEPATFGPDVADHVLLLAVRDVLGAVPPADDLDVTQQLHARVLLSLAHERSPALQTALLELVAVRRWSAARDDQPAVWQGYRPGMRLELLRRILQVGQRPLVVQDIVAHNVAFLSEELGHRPFT